MVEISYHKEEYYKYTNKDLPFAIIKHTFGTISPNMGWDEETIAAFKHPEDADEYVSWMNEKEERALRKGDTNPRENAKHIRDMIRDLEKEYGNSVPLEEVIDIAEGDGIEKEEAEAIIELMKHDGILYSPSKDEISFVK